MSRADAETRIEVQNASAHKRIPAADRFLAWADAVLQVEGRVGAEICVRVVDEDEARQANDRYRGIDRPTNVLSFAVDREGMPEQLRPLGDILLCEPIVTREAAEQSKPVEDHWAHLVVHGVLHLLGYDHESEAEAREMESREIDVLERLGIPNPYKSRTATP